VKKYWECGKETRGWLINAELRELHMYPDDLRQVLSRIFSSEMNLGLSGGDVGRYFHFQRDGSLQKGEILLNPAKAQFVTSPYVRSLRKVHDISVFTKLHSSFFVPTLWRLRRFCTTLITMLYRDFPSNLIGGKEINTAIRR
jgi:hypothetical protein